MHLGGLTHSFTEFRSHVAPCVRRRSRWSVPPNGSVLETGTHSSFDGGVDGHAGVRGKDTSCLESCRISARPGSRNQARPVESHSRCECTSGIRSGVGHAVVSNKGTIASLKIAYGSRDLTPLRSLQTARARLSASPGSCAPSLRQQAARDVSDRTHSKKSPIADSHFTESPSSRFSTSGEWRIFCRTNYSGNGTLRLA